MTMTEKLDSLMAERNISRAELAAQSGIPYMTIVNFYAKGTENVKRSTLLKLARFFGVSLDYLADDSVSDPVSGIPGIFPIEKKKIPLLGEIACGEPIWANESFESYVEVGAEVKADFALRCKGTSMINARILDGDIVFIRKQDMVDDGEIAAVLIDNEATLKRVYYDSENGVLQLYAENPEFKIMRFAGADLDRIRILGKAVAFQSDVR